MSSTPELTPAFLAEDRRPQARIGIAVVTALSALVVLVRVYARGFLIRSFGWDDGLICAALLLNIVVMALSLQVLRYGAGIHIWALTASEAPLLYQWLVAAQLVYMVALWTCRISGLAFYRRLNPMPQFQGYLRASFAFVTAVLVAQVLVIALQCIPLAALWGAAEGTCLGSQTVFISTAALTIVCDSIILLLPVKIVFSIRASPARKTALAVVLCFGILYVPAGLNGECVLIVSSAVMTSICRIIAMIPAIRDTDATWYFSVVMVWSDTEVSTAIIALSLPALKGLVGVAVRRGSSMAEGQSSGSHELHVQKQKGMPHSEEGPLYQGPDLYGSNARAGPGDGSSEEVLWGDGDGDEDEDGESGRIHVRNTVRVSVA
ncbi:hypothetical protein BO70DRAFT_354661 [Aspergillus heteromorphus CBS 117.55]|uniref:Rhodopsin domain-containing protein n=1 Tax=Aspergillus heteromorphus CBS 117.55 TaxID=1448321 RepID=A0A317VM33_9EURO|nr:uncharacterized protein BO70DRAFT_354661 [Aspergillus heteromorphus CBS 117.55]PWY74281.1 hypothetical protein BO70DRAFT_354661 [Aspergillus heteromorphus CBS 117.55]